MAAMPAAVDRTSLGDSVAELARTDPAAAEEVQEAITWILGGEDSDIERISLHALQQFLWYQLPNKWDVSVAEQRHLADALARVFDGVGSSAQRYADICRADATRRLLDEWDRDRESAWDTYLELSEASPVEPPSTDLLEWGSVMGIEESTLYHATAVALEDVLESDELASAGGSLEQTRAAAADRFLETPQAELDGRAPIDVIRLERVRHWAHSRSEPSRRIRGAAVNQLIDLQEPDDAICAQAIERLHWLLSRTVGGIELTATGTVGRAFVREAVERYPDWWDGLRRQPNREAEVFALQVLDELLHDLRLVRRHKRRLKATRLGQQVLADPLLLWTLVAAAVLPPDGFAAEVQQLTAASLIAGPAETRVATVEDQVYDAIVADGWNTDGAPPEARDTDYYVWQLLHLFLALGVVRSVGDYLEPVYSLDEGGRVLLLHALYGQAIQARHSA
jgi:hypothetical protein